MKELLILSLIMFILCSLLLIRILVFFLDIHSLAIRICFESGKKAFYIPTVVLNLGKHLHLGVIKSLERMRLTGNAYAPELCRDRIRRI